MASKHANMIMVHHVLFALVRLPICDPSGLAFIAYSSFLGILKNCLCYKSGPYLTRSVKKDWWGPVKTFFGQVTLTHFATGFAATGNKDKDLKRCLFCGTQLNCHFLEKIYCLHCCLGLSKCVLIISAEQLCILKAGKKT